MAYGGKMQARLIETIDVSNTLGEGVLFRPSDSTVWWSDIQQSKLYCMQWPSLKIEIFEAPQRICSFSFIEGRDDILLVAFETGMALYAPETGQLNWLSQMFERGSGVRMNDGRTDAAGRFWVGSLVERPLEEGEAPSAQLYCTNAHGECASKKQGVHISNGLCWAPDNQTLYFADSPTGIIQRASFDLATGNVGVFEDLYHVEGGFPDGAITDASGMYLSAIWGGSCVLEIDPTGQKRDEINLPASQITCLALGGERGNIMFVTSAKDGLETDASGACVEAKAGSLFILETDKMTTPSRRASIAQNKLATIGLEM
ncbi:SMP-30/gluconolactonase/LRE family protein [Hirschia litorea]|uniref:SMP-30/gluconolactonase/LRE family protein n=1 Tax=Hirschia litorea TaxID=1199156 RepID=A0ABW2IQ22_9PROT